MQIFLIGFMGSGKTTIGGLLAARLSSQFVDLDDEVVRRSGQSIAEIFESSGEQTFRRLEIEALLEAAGGPRAVIATGGGLPAEESAMDLMQEAGLTVWIHPSFDSIVRRLEGSDAGLRPLYQDRAQLEALYRHRLRFYRRAGLEVGVGSTESAEDVVARIAGRLEIGLGELPCAI